MGKLTQGMMNEIWRRVCGRVARKQENIMWTVFVKAENKEPKIYAL